MQNQDKQATAAYGTDDSLPTIVIEFNGGVINSVSSDQPVRVIILDEDTEGGDEKRISEVNRTDVYVYDYRLRAPSSGGHDGIDPEFVASVVEQVEENLQ